MHRTYRVLVRGRFLDLDAGQRTSLIESLPAHTSWQAQLTEQGTLTFDAQLRTFTFRVIVVEDHPDAAARDEAAAETGITAAELALDELRGPEPCTDAPKRRLAWRLHNQRPVATGLGVMLGKIRDPDEHRARCRLGVPPGSRTTTAPSPKASWAPWPPTRQRSVKPYAPQSQPMAASTSRYARTGMMIECGMERLVIKGVRPQSLGLRGCGWQLGQ